MLPTILPFDFGQDPVDILESASITCVISKGDLPMHINWLFDGKKLLTNDGVLISKSGQKISFLSIESVRPRHAGNYTCIAKNDAGETNFTSELKVIGNYSYYKNT